MAELSGAKMLLIVDNNNEDEEAVVMIADCNYFIYYFQINLF